MADRLDARLRTGRKYRLTIHPIVSEEVPVSESSYGQRYEAPEATILAPADLQFIDASTRLNTSIRSGAGDLQNIFVAQSYESSVTQTVGSELALRQQIITNCDTSESVRYLYSNRPNYGRCWPLQDTTETDGFNLTAYLKSDVSPVTDASETRTFAVQSTLPHCRGMVSATNQLSAFDSYADSIRWDNEDERAAVRANIDQLNYEKFDGYTSARAQRDLMLSARVPPGRWNLGVANAYHYHPFETWNTTDYKVTSLTYFDAPETPLGFGTGEFQRADVRVFLIPQRHRYVYQYWALYTFATLFLPPLLVPIPQTGTFLGRMPFYPRSFVFSGTTFSGANDFAVSKFIGASRQIGISFAQDLATQYFSPYSAFVLDRRVEGRWSIRATNLKAGELAAIYDVVTNGVTERRYVWRRTQMTRSELIDYGPLDITPLLYPMDRSGGQFSMTSGPLTPP